MNHARATGESFNSLLEQYATGRFLWRLSQSPYRKRFILKGAQLFRLWSESVHRPTRDLDLLGFGDPSEEGLATVLTKICKGLTAPDDGLLWGVISTAPIREDMDYGGTRALLQATLDGARVPLQIDVGFGDAITPDPLSSPFSSTDLILSLFSVYEGGDENGGRGEASPLVIRSRRRSRQPISYSASFRSTRAATRMVDDAKPLHS